MNWFAWVEFRFWCRSYRDQITSAAFWVLSCLCCSNQDLQCFLPDEWNCDHYVWHRHSLFAAYHESESKTSKEKWQKNGTIVFTTWQGERKTTLQSSRPRATGTHKHVTPICNNHLRGNRGIFVLQCWFIASWRIGGIETVSDHVLSTKGVKSWEWNHGLPNETYKLQENYYDNL